MIMGYTYKEEFMTIIVICIVSFAVSVLSCLITGVALMSLYEKSALVGNVEAQYNLGRCYEFGYDGKIDISQAIEWYKKAANQNNMYAQYRLGVCYEEGSGVEEDIFEAVEWYKKSAEQGHEVAQHSLGECYKEGLGVEKDDKSIYY